MNAVFCVNGNIGELPIQFLIDSGTAVSVVNHNVVKQQPIGKAKICVLSANETPLDVVGQMTVNLQLGDFKVDYPFIVVNTLTIDCLLKADILQMHGAVLDCHSNTLSVGQNLEVVIPNIL